MSTNQRAATFELNKRWSCSSGILIEFSNWHNFFEECMELCWKVVAWSSQLNGVGSTNSLKPACLHNYFSDGMLNQFKTTWPHHNSVYYTNSNRERDQMEPGGSRLTPDILIKSKNLFHSRVHPENTSDSDFLVISSERDPSQMLKTKENADVKHYECCDIFLTYANVVI